MPQDPIRVEVPSLGTVEFPAGTDPAVMTAAIQRTLKQQSTPTPGLSAIDPIAKAIGVAAPFLAPAATNIARWTTTHPEAAGATGAGLAMAPLTAGMSLVPAMATAFGAGIVGSGTGSAVRAARGEDVSLPEAAKTALVSGGVNAATEGVGAAVTGLAQWAAPRLMQSALKPGVRLLRSTVTGKTEIPPVVQSALNEGINVTPGGVRKALQTSRDIDTGLTSDLAQIPGATIQPAAIADRLNPLVDRLSKQVNPEADFNAVSAVNDEFRRNYTQPMTPLATHEVKQGTYQAIGDKAYGEMGSTTIEAQKQLARGAKEEIEAAANAAGRPDIAARNARSGNLRDVASAAGEQVAKAGNRDPFGIGILNPKTMAAHAMFRSPAAKSVLANTLYSAAPVAGPTLSALLRAALLSQLGGGQ